MTASGSFDALVAEHPYPGVRRQTIESKQTTVATYSFEPGAKFPLHRHPQEQVTLITDGDVRMSVAEESLLLRAGDWSIVESDVEHSITAGPHGARFVAIIVPRRGDAGDYVVVREGE